MDSNTFDSVGLLTLNIVACVLCLPYMLERGDDSADNTLKWLLFSAVFAVNLYFALARLLLN